MHLLNWAIKVVTFSYCNPPKLNNSINDAIIAFAPIVSLLVSIANLLLVFVVFRYTRHKNDNDVKLKWFQELVYTPNKEAIKLYFENLYNIKGRIPIEGELTEDEKIELMQYVKDEGNSIVNSFVGLLNIISTPLYEQILKAVENLTDELTKVLDNDELKLNNAKTFNREFTNRISQYRGEFIGALYKHKG